MQATYPAPQLLLNSGASTGKNGAVIGFEVSEAPVPQQANHPAVHIAVQPIQSAGPPELEAMDSKSKRRTKKPFLFCFI